MNIKEELLKEKVQTKTNSLAIAEYASSSPKHFEELIKCFLANEYRLAQRAAWSVSWAARKKPELIKPYINSIFFINYFQKLFGDHTNCNQTHS